MVVPEAVIVMLDRWGMYRGGVNPVARTNVCPEYGKPRQPTLYAFSYMDKRWTTRCVSHRLSTGRRLSTMLHSAPTIRFKIREIQNHRPTTCSSLFHLGCCPNYWSHRIFTQNLSVVSARTGKPSGLCNRERIK